MKMSPLREIPTMMASSRSASGISVGWGTCAISTDIPFCNIGVTTMKMISSTNMMSAMGIIFGAAMTEPDWTLKCAMLFLSASPRDEVVDQLHGGVVHLHVESFTLVGEIVEGPHGRYGHEQAERGGDQGFRNTAGYRGKTGCLLSGDALKRVDDADHRAEQSDEGGRGADRCQAAQAALHVRVH